jgi:hypothetical protein
MATTTARWPSRVLSLWAAGFVLVVAMVGYALLVAPEASAYCVLTAQDRMYISFLQEENIGPAPGYTWCDAALGNRQIADEVRASPNPLATAVSIAQRIYYNSNLTLDQANWEVADAVTVYAPEVRL